MRSFSNESWFWWRTRKSATMDSIRSASHTIWPSIAWNHAIHDAHWVAMLVSNSSCCWRAKHKPPRSHCTWRLRPNVTNGWKRCKKQCELTRCNAHCAVCTVIELSIRPWFFFLPFSYFICLLFVYVGTIWSRSAAGTPITNSKLRRSTVPLIVGIVRNFSRDASTRDIVAKYARFVFIKDASRRRADASQLARVHRFATGSCPNFIGLLVQWTVIRRPLSSRIAKSARICCASVHKWHPIRMRRCMRSVWSELISRFYSMAKNDTTTTKMLEHWFDFVSIGRTSALSSTWKSTKRRRTIIHCIICRHGVILKPSLNWCRSTNAMILAKILLGKPDSCHTIITHTQAFCLFPLILDWINLYRGHIGKLLPPRCTISIPQSPIN